MPKEVLRFLDGLTGDFSNWRQASTVCEGKIDHGNWMSYKMLQFCARVIAQNKIMTQFKAMWWWVQQFMPENADDFSNKVIDSHHYIIRMHKQIS
jgi:hypothetical protein